MLSEHTSPPIQTTAHALTIEQAASALGVSVMTVRRQIKRGHLKAQMVQGKFGPEWRVYLGQPYTSPSPAGDGLSNDLYTAEHSLSAAQTIAQESPDQAMLTLLQMFRDLQVDARRVQEANRKLHEERAELFGRLGFYQARIQDLEYRILELQAPKEAPVERANHPTPGENEADSGSGKTSGQPWWKFWRWYQP